MEEDVYYTLETLSVGEYTEKRSKFLAFALPIDSIENIKEEVKYYQKKYYDARHVCYAYKLGVEHIEVRANDNGEPSGTAGKPILGQIQSFNLTNVLVIVVRYFGGIKLGTGGLVQAYKQAAWEALNTAKVKTSFVKQTIEISFEYPLLNSVMKVIKEEEPEIVTQIFEMQCKMQLAIRKKKYEILFAKLSNIEGVMLKTE